MVKGNGDLHVLVPSESITMAQKHDLVVVGQVIVGYGNGSGSMDGINQPITAIGERTVIHPNMAPTKDGDAITI